MRAIRRFTVRPVLPEPLAALGTLAANLRWSWHPPTQDVFAAVDPERWEATGFDVDATAAFVLGDEAESWLVSRGRTAVLVPTVGQPLLLRAVELLPAGAGVHYHQ